MFHVVCSQFFIVMQRKPNIQWTYRLVCDFKFWYPINSSPDIWPCKILPSLYVRRRRPPSVVNKCFKKIFSEIAWYLVTMIFGMLAANVIAVTTGFSHITRKQKKKHYQNADNLMSSTRQSEDLDPSAMQFLCRSVKRRRSYCPCKVVLGFFKHKVWSVTRCRRYSPSKSCRFFGIFFNFWHLISQTV